MEMLTKKNLLIVLIVVIVGCTLACLYGCDKMENPFTPSEAVAADLPEVPVIASDVSTIVPTAKIEEIEPVVNPMEEAIEEAKPEGKCGASDKKGGDKKSGKCGEGKCGGK